MFFFWSAMFKELQKNGGQVTMTEYLVIFFLVIGAIVSMSVYVQRALQGRMRDARQYMITEAAKAHQGPIHYEYEPYYGYVASNVQRAGRDVANLAGGSGTSIFRKSTEQSVAISTYSNQAAPKDAQ
jgi:hypothetical protein